MKSLTYVAVDPQGPVQAVVIWLHGLGDSGHGFAPIVPELKLPSALGIRFVFPHAPMRPITINNGMRMNAWYDLKTLDLNDRADETGVKESVELVRQLIDCEIAKGIPANRIVLAGFSQGGVIALHLAARIEYQLAAIMGLSTYLCKPEKLAAEKHTANLNTPILLAHGNQDDVVPMKAGEQARDVLLANGFTTQWRVYPMPHSVCSEQLVDISTFLQQRLKIPAALIDPIG